MSGQWNDKRPMSPHLQIWRWLFSFIFMALAQLRHAVWGQGAMMKPELNNVLSYAMIAIALLLAIVSTLAAIGAA